MNEKKKALVQVHLSVLLFGLSGLFGKVVTLPAPLIVLGRTIFSSAFLYLVLLVRGKKVKLDEVKHYPVLFLCGVILAVHWVSFIYAIQLSTVAVGTITFSTFPVFVTFLEPILFKEKMKKSAVATSLVMLGGMVLLIPEISFENNVTAGVAVGMVSSVTYAVLSLVNRKYTRMYAGTKVAFYEQCSAAMVLLPLSFVYEASISLEDIGYLVFLGIVCTAIAHSLFIDGIKKVKVQTAGIISGMESAYGILAGMVFLREMPSLNEVLGGLVVLCAAFYATIKNGKG